MASVQIAMLGGLPYTALREAVLAHPTIVDPPKGASVPSDMKVQVAVQPVSGRLPEKSYAAWREKLLDRVEFKTLVPFDKEETWRIRVLLSSSQLSGETDTDVQVTPTLLGRWDLLLFFLPFLGIEFLWYRP